MFLMRLKDCPHISHWWGFSRVWVSKWYFKFCLRVASKLHSGHLKVSPVWTSLCALSWLLWAVANPHTSHKCSFVVLWVTMWFFSACFHLNPVSQILHTNGFTLECLGWWKFNWVLVLNLWSQYLQKYGSGSSCFFMWFSKSSLVSPLYSQRSQWYFSYRCSFLWMSKSFAFSQVNSQLSHVYFFVLFSRLWDWLWRW